MLSKQPRGAPGRLTGFRGRLSVDWRCFSFRMCQSSKITAMFATARSPGGGVIILSFSFLRLQETGRRAF